MSALRRTAQIRQGQMASTYLVTICDKCSKQRRTEGIAHRAQES
ncbi:hypothetical protein [Pseudomonas sp. OV226]|nr:hypothetical protein [Pseudomonas sp. OV226]